MIAAEEPLFEKSGKQVARDRRGSVGGQGDSCQDHTGALPVQAQRFGTRDGLSTGMQHEVMNRIQAGQNVRCDLIARWIESKSLDQTAATRNSPIRNQFGVHDPLAGLNPAMIGDIDGRVGFAENVCPESVRIERTGEHPGHADNGDGRPIIHVETFAFDRTGKRSGLSF